MNSLTLTPDIQLMVTDLAGQLHVPEMEIMRQAVAEYAKKVSKKKRLMSFAAILSESEADTLFCVIQDRRVNKDVFF